MLDEHLLGELVGFLDELVVMPLSHFTDLRELRKSQRASRFTECLERVLGLASQYDVPDEPDEVALLHDVRQIASRAESHGGGLLGQSVPRTERRLVFLKHALMLQCLRNEASAQLAIARVSRLGLVILDGLCKGAMHEHRVGYLALQKVDTAFHGSLH